MAILRLLFLALIISGCATRGEKLRADNSTYPDQKILDVPFYTQKDFYCGPASMAIVANNLGLSTSPEELAKILYTPESKGTFQNDMLGGTRRLGLIATPINEMKKIIQELNNRNPVLIFQNLGLSWIPKWHYAVVIGYDLNSNEMILHSGEFKNFRLNLRTFENTWDRVENWGYVIVAPGTIPVTSTEIEMVKATAGLEMVNLLNEAQISYEKILIKWPNSLGALTGLGNIHYQKKEFEKSVNYFKKASEIYPQSTGIKNNYALAQKAFLNQTN